MNIILASAGDSWLVSPGGLAVSALADLSPVKAPPAPGGVNAGFGGFFLIFLLLAW